MSFPLDQRPAIVAIAGPNGAGKTTTVRMLTSVLEPTAGWARVAGFDVVKQAPQVRASVGVLPEHQLEDFLNRIAPTEAERKAKGIVWTRQQKARDDWPRAWRWIASCCGNTT